MDDAMPDLTRVSETVVTMTPLEGPPPKGSYSAIVPQNYPNLNFSVRLNPFWKKHDQLGESSNDETP